MIMDTKKLESIIWRCMLSRKLADRIKYGKILTEEIKKIYSFSNDMIDKLVTAGQTISEMNEWIDVLYVAMEQNKDDIIRKAIIGKKSIEHYKKRLKRED